MVKSTFEIQQEYKLFDRTFYLDRNPDVAQNPGVDPLKHYLTCGGFEGRDPHVLFDSAFYLRPIPQVAEKKINPLVHYMTEGSRQGLDCHPLFSTSFYLEQGLSMEECSFNPLLHYLECGALKGFNPHTLFDSAFYLQQVERIEGLCVTCNPLVHYLTVGAQLGLNPSSNFDGAAYLKRYPDLAAAGVNPLLHFAKFGELECRIGRRVSSADEGISSVNREYFKSAFAKWKTATAEPFSYLIVTGSLLRGGSERSACNLARALAQKVGVKNVVFLVTEVDGMTCSDWLHEGARVVNMPAIEKRLTTEERGILILEVLERHQVDFAVDVNEFVFLKALDGLVPALRNRLPTKFVLFLSNYEPYVNDNIWGYIDGELFRLVKSFDLVVTDNERLRQDLLARHKDVSSIESKVKTCYKALEANLHDRLSAIAASRKRENTAGAKRILWASRIDAIKQPYMVAEIARRMPDVQFYVYGRTEHPDENKYFDGIPNIILCGEFDEFSAIPIQDKSAFLYTSKGDGVPRVLMEAGACGLPIVTTNIGAITELIDDKTGWVLDRHDDTSEFVRVLRYVLAHPEEAAERAANLKALIDERYSWPAYVKRLLEVNIWDLRKRLPETRT